jgi:hypothetical protein
MLPLFELQAEHGKYDGKPGRYIERHVRNAAILLCIERRSGHLKGEHLSES